MSPDDRDTAGSVIPWHRACCGHTLPACHSHSPPTALHRQIKVLHEALARIFFHTFKHKRDRQALQAQQRNHAWWQRVPLQLQMAFSDLHTHLTGAQHIGMVARCAGQGRQPFGFAGTHVALDALGVVGL